MTRPLLSDVPPPDYERLLMWCALIAFVGGGVKAILHRTDKTRWFDVVAAATASAVAGTLTALVLIYFWPTDHGTLIGAIAGLAGWIGVVLLDWAASVAMTRVQQKLNGEHPKE